MRGVQRIERKSYFLKRFHITISPKKLQGLPGYFIIFHFRNFFVYPATFYIARIFSEIPKFFAVRHAKAPLCKKGGLTPWQDKLPANGILRIIKGMEEGSGPGCGRFPEKGLGVAALLHHLPMLNEQDPVRDGPGEIHLMGDNHHGAARSGQ